LLGSLESERVYGAVVLEMRFNTQSWRGARMISRNGAWARSGYLRTNHADDSFAGFATSVRQG
jgi:hypothetical protein